MNRKKKKLPLTDQGSLGSSLGAALKAQGFNESAQPGPLPTEKTPPGATPTSALPKVKKVVLSRERKGRGGKTVTVVSGFGQQSAPLKPLARTLGKALGTGVKVEGETLIVQGDQIVRLKEWFKNEGVATVISGG